MDDLISKQDFDKFLKSAEEEAMKKRKYVFANALNTIRGNLKDFPSAEPEIIYCEDCIQWTRTHGDDRWSVGDCNLLDEKLVMCKGYCAWGQRRTDE